ncbi:MAG: type III-B CRISPR module RAMP protein Cmr1 [Candidatus Binatia bacterium]|nr:type III-B CRISPR module RAMP protein Cmr1 [Candidatus Binatia bacterium]
MSDYILEARTDVWTGDADRRGDRTITTGLLGSIRWWFEVLVRGLGGTACDPTGRQSQRNSHCVVCELFGCTGWARKFRLEVLNESRRVKAARIKQGDTFTLRFTELRPMAREEWALLDLTLRFVAEYGALGGKTVLKPSNEVSRTNAAHHRDYGLINISDFPEDLWSCHRELLQG